MKVKIETIEALEKWMIENHYQKNSYTIGHYFFTAQGFGIENNGELFSWFYSEKGEKETIKYFIDEKHAAEYAFKIINKK